MIFRRIVACLAGLSLIASPALATDRKPLVLGASGQQQQIQSSDTLSVPSAKVTGISGSTQCVQANSAGLLSGTGAICGGGGGGAGALTLISEVVTSASQTSVTFSSIAGTYRDLIVVVRGRGTTAALANDIRLQFNGDTGANYQYQEARWSGTASAIGQTTAATYAKIEAAIPAGTAIANYAGSATSRIYDYRGTTFYKTLASQVAVPFNTTTNTHGVGIYSGQWLNTAAITSILVTLDAGAFVDGSVVSLYGSM